MNKYAYLEELRRRIGRLSQYETDNIVNDYSMAIGRMLDDYKGWDQIQAEIGTPKEAARRVLDGKPMYIAADNRQPAGGGVYYGEPAKPIKKRGFWKFYWITGIVSVPLTIAAGAVLLSLAVTALALIISGPAAFIYSAAIGILAASPMLFFTYGGAALLICGTGLLLMWVTKRLFIPVKAVFAGRRKN